MSRKAAFSVAQLADRWGCSTGHIYSLVKQERLRFFRIGTLIRVSAEEVERIEGCGSQSIAANGPLSEPMDTARSGADRFAPVIAPPPNGASATYERKHRGIR